MNIAEFSIKKNVITWSLTLVLVSGLFAGGGAPLDRVASASAMPLAIFAGLLPLTLGGFGTREAALVALLAGQVLAADALAAGLLYSLYTYVLLGSFGLFLTLFLLFCRYLPIIAIAEVKAVMPKANPHAHGDADHAGHAEAEASS